MPKDARCAKCNKPLYYSKKTDKWLHQNSSTNHVAKGGPCDMCGKDLLTEHTSAQRANCAEAFRQENAGG